MGCKVMVIRSIIAAVASLLLVGQVHAGRTGYNMQKNILTIPSMVVEGVRYNFPRFRIVSVELVDPGVSSQAPSGLPVCALTTSADPSVITQEKLDRIQLGMTLDEVNQIIGCQYETPVSSIYDNMSCDGPGCPDESYENFIWYGFRCGDYCVNSISVSVDMISRRVVEKSGIFRQ